MVDEKKKGERFEWFGGIKETKRHITAVTTLINDIATAFVTFKSNWDGLMDHPEPGVVSEGHITGWVKA